MKFYWYLRTKDDAQTVREYLVPGESSYEGTNKFAGIGNLVGHFRDVLGQEKKLSAFDAEAHARAYLHRATLMMADDDPDNVHLPITGIPTKEKHEALIGPHALASHESGLADLFRVGRIIIDTSPDPTDKDRNGPVFKFEKDVLTGLQGMIFDPLRGVHTANIRIKAHRIIHAPQPASEGEGEKAMMKVATNLQKGLASLDEMRRINLGEGITAGREVDRKRTQELNLEAQRLFEAAIKDDGVRDNVTAFWSVANQWMGDLDVADLLTLGNDRALRAASLRMYAHNYRGIEDKVAGDIKSLEQEALGFFTQIIQKKKPQLLSTPSDVVVAQTFSRFKGKWYRSSQALRSGPGVLFRSVLVDSVPLDPQQIGLRYPTESGREDVLLLNAENFREFVLSLPRGLAGLFDLVGLSAEPAMVVPEAAMMASLWENKKARKKFIDENLPDVKAGKAAEVVIKPDASVEEGEEVIRMLRAEYGDEGVFVADVNFMLSEAQVRSWYEGPFTWIRTNKTAEAAKSDIDTILDNMQKPLRVVIVREKNGAQLDFDKMTRVKAAIRAKLKVDKTKPLNKVHMADSVQAATKEVSLLNGVEVVSVAPQAEGFTFGRQISAVDFTRANLVLTGVDVEGGEQNISQQVWDNILAQARLDSRGFPVSRVTFPSGTRPAAVGGKTTQLELRDRGTGKVTLVSVSVEGDSFKFDTEVSSADFARANLFLTGVEGGELNISQQVWDNVLAQARPRQSGFPVDRVIFEAGKIPVAAAGKTIQLELRERAMEQQESPFFAPDAQAPQPAHFAPLGGIRLGINEFPIDISTPKVLRIVTANQRERILTVSREEGRISVTENGQEIFSRTGSGQGDLLGSVSSPESYVRVRYSPVTFEISAPKASGGIVVYMTEAAMSKASQMLEGKLTVVEDKTAMAREAARGLVEKIRKMQTAGRTPFIGVGTGETIGLVYEELAKIFAVETDLNLSDVSFIAQDEYLGLGAEDPQSYRLFVMKNLIEKLRAVDPRRAPLADNVISFQGQAASSEAELARVIEEIRKRGGINSQLIAGGRDGHFAFIGPAIRIDSREAIRRQENLINIRERNEVVLDKSKLSITEIRSWLEELLAVRREERMKLAEQPSVVRDAVSRRQWYLKEHALPEPADLAGIMKAELNVLSEKMLREQSLVAYVDGADLEAARKALAEMSPELSRQIILKDRKDFWTEPAKIVDLTLSTILANSRYFDALDKVPLKAYSLAGLLLEAEEIVHLAFKPELVSALTGMVSEPLTVENPFSALVRQNGYRAIFTRDLVTMIPGLEEASTGVSELEVAKEIKDLKFEPADQTRRVQGPDIYSGAWKYSSGESYAGGFEPAFAFHVRGLDQDGRHTIGLWSKNDGGVGLEMGALSVQADAQAVTAFVRDHVDTKDGFKACAGALTTKTREKTNEALLVAFRDLASKAEAAMSQKKEREAKAQAMLLARKIGDLVAELNGIDIKPRVHRQDLFAFGHDVSAMVKFIQDHTVLKRPEDIYRVLSWRLQSRGRDNNHQVLSGVSSRQAEDLFDAVFDQEAYLKQMAQKGPANVVLFRRGRSRPLTHILKTIPNVNVKVMLSGTDDGPSWFDGADAFDAAGIPGAGKALIDLSRDVDAARFCEYRISGKGRRPADLENDFRTFVRSLSDPRAVKELSGEMKNLYNIAMRMMNDKSNKKREEVALSLQRFLDYWDERKQVSRHAEVFTLHEVPIRSILLVGMAQERSGNWQQAVNDLAKILNVKDGHEVIFPTERRGHMVALAKDGRLYLSEAGINFDSRRSEFVKLWTVDQAIHQKLLGAVSLEAEKARRIPLHKISAVGMSDKEAANEMRETVRIVDQGNMEDMVSFLDTHSINDPLKDHARDVLKDADVLFYSGENLETNIAGALIVPGAREAIGGSTQALKVNVSEVASADGARDLRKIVGRLVQYIGGPGVTIDGPKAASYVDYVLAGVVEKVNPNLVEKSLVDIESATGQRIRAASVNAAVDQGTGFYSSTALIDSVVSLMGIKRAGFALSASEGLIPAKNAGKDRNEMGLFTRDEKVRKLIEHIKTPAVWRQIVEKGAFVFDVDKTILPKVSEGLNEYKELAYLFMRLLREGVRVSIISGNSLEEQMPRIHDAIKEEMRDDLSAFQKLSFYVDGGATKVKFDSNGKAQVIDDYNKSRVMNLPEVQKEINAALQELGAGKFGLDPVEQEAFKAALQEYLAGNSKLKDLKMDLPWLEGRPWEPQWLTPKQVAEINEQHGTLAMPWVEMRGAGNGVGSLSIKPTPETGKDPLRAALQEKILARLTAAGVSAGKYNLRSGGATSTDMTQANAEKPGALLDFIETEGLDPSFVYYFGDEFFDRKGKSGNDEAIAKSSDPTLAKVNTLAGNDDDIQGANAKTTWIGRTPQATTEFMGALLESAMAIQGKSVVKIRRLRDEALRAVDNLSFADNPRADHAVSRLGEKIRTLNRILRRLEPVEFAMKQVVLPVVNPKRLEAIAGLVKVFAEKGSTEKKIDAVKLQEQAKKETPTLGVGSFDLTLTVWALARLGEDVRINEKLIKDIRDILRSVRGISEVSYESLDWGFLGEEKKATIIPVLEQAVSLMRLSNIVVYRDLAPTSYVSSFDDRMNILRPLLLGINGSGVKNFIAAYPMVVVDMLEQLRWGKKDPAGPWSAKQAVVQQNTMALWMKLLEAGWVTKEALGLPEAQKTFQEMTEYLRKLKELRAFEAITNVDPKVPKSRHDLSSAASELLDAFSSKGFPVDQREAAMQARVKFEVTDVEWRGFVRPVENVVRKLGIHTLLPLVEQLKAATSPRKMWEILADMKVKVDQLSLQDQVTLWQELAEQKYFAPPKQGLILFFEKTLRETMEAISQDHTILTEHKIDPKDQRQIAGLFSLARPKLSEETAVFWGIILRNIDAPLLRKIAEHAPEAAMSTLPLARQSSVQLGEGFEIYKSKVKEMALLITRSLGKDKLGRYRNHREDARQETLRAMKALMEAQNRYQEIKKRGEMNDEDYGGLPNMETRWAQANRGNFTGGMKALDVIERFMFEQLDSHRPISPGQDLVDIENNLRALAYAYLVPGLMEGLRDAKLRGSALGLMQEQGLSGGDKRELMEFVQQVMKTLPDGDRESAMMLNDLGTLRLEGSVDRSAAELELMRKHEGPLSRAVADFSAWRPANYPPGVTPHLDSLQALLTSMIKSKSLSKDEGDIMRLFIEGHDQGYAVNLTDEAIKADLMNVWQTIALAQGYPADEARRLSEKAYQFIQDMTKTTGLQNYMVTRVLAHGTVSMIAVMKKLQEAGMDDPSARLGLALLFAAHHPGYPISMVHQFVVPNVVPDELAPIFLINEKKDTPGGADPDRLRFAVADKGADLLKISKGEARRIAALGYALDRTTPARREVNFGLGNLQMKDHAPIGKAVWTGGETSKKYPLIVTNIKEPKDFTIQKVFELTIANLTGEAKAAIKTMNVLGDADLAKVFEAQTTFEIARTKAIQDKVLALIAPDGRLGQRVFTGRLEGLAGDIEIALELYAQMDLVTDPDREALEYLIGFLSTIYNSPMAMGHMRGIVNGKKDVSVIVDALKRSMVGEYFDMPEMEALALSLGTAVREYKDGEHIIKEGEHGTEAFVIVSGNVDVQKGSQTVAALGPGKLIGEIALVANIPRTASVVANGPVYVVVIPGDSLLKMVRENRPFAVETFLMMGRRLQADATNGKKVESAMMLGPFLTDLAKLKGKEILVVEDDLSVQRAYKWAIPSSGLKMHLAVNGRDALVKLEALRAEKKDPQWLPDVVMTDRNMPEMNGEELAATLRGAYPHLPIMMVTGGYTEEQMKMMAAKVEGFIIASKPVDLDVMFKMFSSLIPDQPVSVVSPVEAAMAPGGIDLNAKKMGLDIEKSGAGVEMILDPAQFEKFRTGDFTGLVPVILKVTPIKSPLPILGMSEKDLTPVAQADMIEPVVWVKREEEVLV
ncbi:MAG: cyclic nucleotide-binding domain-containing protein [Candidatus Omnitrophica bacterium]|nr:cyclic nucleotide-binding domain-containing protein [Candidatus Omnitrophota bacterium]